MATNAGGNQTVSSDFLRVLLTLKQNIFNDLHVAEVATLNLINEYEDYTTYSCTSLTNTKLNVECFALQGLELERDDLVVILFIDGDFRLNYKRYIKSQTVQDADSTERHAMSYGIIIGKL